ncbi:MAG: hypothetical protein OEZ19_00895 [Paracoccaceae bacterium]|nr:hypothetical protein [Paracoccaceae bacterium]
MRTTKSRRITIYPNDVEMEVEAEFEVEFGEAMRDEEGGPGKWVLVGLERITIGRLALYLAEVKLLLGNDAVCEINSDAATYFMNEWRSV